MMSCESLYMLSGAHRAGEGACNCASLLQAFGVFGLCQIHGFVDYLRSKLSAQQFEFLFKTLAMFVGGVTLLVGGVLTAMGSILHPRWESM